MTNIKQIVKRDGRTVQFDIDKIADAIYKAASALGGTDKDVASYLAKQVELYLFEIKKNDSPSVEEIQDAVEKILIESGHARTAKEFIIYRSERTRVRDMNTKLMKVYEDLTFKDAKDNDVKRENANIDGDTAMGTMLKYGSEGAKQFYEMFVLDPSHARAHREGDIHIHDLDFLTLTTTCCQIDLVELFKGGFSTGHGFLREPNDIQSYSALACIAIQSNQNDQHGGQSVPTFDYAMAMGVKKTFRRLYWSNLGKLIDILHDREDTVEKTKELGKIILKETGIYPVMSDDNNYCEIEAPYLEQIVDKSEVDKLQKKAMEYSLKEVKRATYQAMEAFVHNLNTMHSRAGAQIPFSSINYGTDTSPEGRLVTEAVLMATDSGLGNGETPIFPIHIFKVKEGINYNPEDPNYDLFQLAIKVSAKRLFPNFAFIDAPYNIKFYEENNPISEVAYMGCRTRVIANVNDTSRQTVAGRGNLSFTSINLPRIALKAHGNVDFFFDELDRIINLVSAQMMDRYKIQAGKKVKNFPFLMGQGIWMDSEKLSSEDTIGEVLKHGTLSMGFIGLAEALKALVGSHHGETEEARRLGFEIIGY
ncbi:MAG: anaerobic ribonucleoside triphosphate reductase, partial [Anaerovoracaceae bacterium]